MNPLPEENPSTMNLHAFTFEQILQMCASMEDPIEISKLIQALDILERNIRYRRKELIGQLKEIEAQDEQEKQEQRRAVKSSLRLVTQEDEADSKEDAT
jgi:hypothetical protein